MKGHVPKKKTGATWHFVVDLPRKWSVSCTAGHETPLLSSMPPRSCSHPGCTAALGTPTSRRNQKWQRGFPTRKAAEKALREFLVGLDQGNDPFPVRITAAEWFVRWLDSPHVAVLRPHTRARYRQMVRDDVLPVIGDLELSQVRRRHIAAVIERCRDRGLATRTLAQTRAVMSTAFRRAVDDEIIAVNPVAGLRLENPGRPKLDIPTASQMADLLDTARPTVWHIPILLSVTTGTRRSETLGIRWTDIDLDKGTLHVRQSLQRIHGAEGSQLEFTGLKTERARREFALPATTLAELRVWRTAQARRRLKLGTAWHDLDLVCDRGDGAPFDPDAYSAAFKRLAAAAGLSAATRLHDLRHGFATTLLETGMNPAIASAILGHAQESFTMSVYQHVQPHMTVAAADAIDRALHR